MHRSRSMDNPIIDEESMFRSMQGSTQIQPRNLLSPNPFNHALHSAALLDRGAHIRLWNFWAVDNSQYARIKYNIVFQDAELENLCGRWSYHEEFRLKWTDDTKEWPLLNVTPPWMSSTLGSWWVSGGAALRVNWKHLTRRLSYRESDFMTSNLDSPAIDTCFHCSKTIRWHHWMGQM